MRKTIRRKLLFSIACMLTLLYVLLCIGISFFVYNLLVERAVRDKRQTLLQAEQQLNIIFQLSDMMARQVMTDEDMSEIIELVRTGPVSRRYVAITRADPLLRQYIVMNPFVANIAVISWDGFTFSNQGVYLADEYQTRLRTQWFQKFAASSDRMMLSDIYEATVSNGQRTPVVSMVYKYKNMPDDTGKENYLMVDIPTSKFSAFLKSSLGENQLLVSTDSGQTISPNALIKAADMEKANMRGELLYLPKVVVLSAEMKNSGWNLYYPIPHSEFNRPIVLLLTGLIGTFVLALFISIAALSRVIGKLVMPVHTVTTTMQAAYNGNLNVYADVKSGDEFEILSDCFNKLIDDLKMHIRHIVEDEKAKKQMQLDLLMSQIHPHFIYNTLNSAVYLIEEHDDQKAIEVIYSLIDILQDTVRIGSKEILSTVAREIELLNAYVTIVRVRYPNSFSVETQCDPGLLQEPIPKVLIQPLVENAIIHGILPGRVYGHVWVNIEKQNEDICIQVDDDGIGLEHERLEDILQNSSSGSHGVGLLNIQNRIRFLYSATGFDFSILSRPGGGTRVRILLPIEKKP